MKNEDKSIIKKLFNRILLCIWIAIRTVWNKTDILSRRQILPAKRERRGTVLMVFAAISVCMAVITANQPEADPRVPRNRDPEDSVILGAEKPQEADTIHVSEGIDRIEYITGARALIFGVSNYQRYDGTFDKVNINIYTREQRTADGNKIGVWTGTAIVEFPDSSNGWIFHKLRDGSLIKQRFIGIAYYNTETEEYQLIKPSVVSGKDVKVSENVITYQNIYTGVNLSYLYFDKQLKAELTILESERLKFISPYPENKSLLVLVSEIDYGNLTPQVIKNEKIQSIPQSGTENTKIEYDAIALVETSHRDVSTLKFNLPFGWVYFPRMETSRWDVSTIGATETIQDSAKRDRMEQFVGNEKGKNLLFSGITFNTITDISENPGAVVFDPSVTWQHGATFGKDNYIYQKAGYTLRNYGITTNLVLNCFPNEARRILIQFDSLQNISSGSQIDSAFLIFTVTGTIQSSADTFNTSLHIVTKTWNEGTALGSGADTLKMAACWDSSSTGILWTTAGGDYIGKRYGTRTVTYLKASGDTVRYTVTALIDTIVNGGLTNYGFLLRYDAENHVESRYINFASSDNTTATYRPKLVIYYTLPLSKPYNVSISSLTDSSFTILVTDSNKTLRKGLYLYRKDGAKLDSVLVPGSSGLYTWTVTHSGYTPNVPDSFKVAVFDSASPPAIVYQDGYEKGFTLAGEPGVVIRDTSATSMRLTRSSDGNPTTVKYAFYEGESKIYIDSLGRTSGSIVWNSFSVVNDTIRLQFIMPNRRYAIVPFVRNSDGVVTTGDTTALWSWAFVPDVISAFAYSKDSILIKIDPGLNPPYTFIAIEDSITGLFVDYAAHRLRSAGVTADSSWAWATYGEWGGAFGYYINVEPDRRYVFRAYAKEGYIRY